MLGLEYGWCKGGMALNSAPLSIQEVFRANTRPFGGLPRLRGIFITLPLHCGDPELPLSRILAREGEELDGRACE